MKQDRGNLDMQSDVIRAFVKKEKKKTKFNSPFPQDLV